MPAIFPRYNYGMGLVRPHLMECGAGQASRGVWSWSGLTWSVELVRPHVECGAGQASRGVWSWSGLTWSVELVRPHMECGAGQASRGVWSALSWDPTQHKLTGRSSTLHATDDNKVLGHFTLRRNYNCSFPCRLIHHRFALPVQMFLLPFSVERVLLPLSMEQVIAATFLSQRSKHSSVIV